MNRLLPQPLISVAVLATWLLANNSVKPGQVVLAMIFGVTIPLLTAPFWPEYPRVRNWPRLVRMTLIFLYDVVIANVRVAILVLGPVRRLRPSFLRIPLDVTSPFTITVLASMISLTPGTVSSNLSRDRKTLLVHGLDVGDEDDEVRSIKERYERALIEVFGC